MGYTFEQVDAMLEPEVVGIFLEVYESFRTAPRDSRGLFVSESLQGTSLHVIGGRFRGSVPDDDLRKLLQVGLSQQVNKARHTFAPEAGAYYEHVRRRQGQPLQVIEQTIVQRVTEDGTFARRYPETVQRLSHAAMTLHGEGADGKATEIGHAVREALLAFPRELAAHLRVELDEPADKTVERLRRLIRSREPKIGSESVGAYLDALVTYWGTVTDLGHRQEHGAAQEPSKLTWEDSRRVVAAALHLVYEVDRALA